MCTQDLTREQLFFHQISPIILDFTKTASKKIATVKKNIPGKGVEFATAADIGVEEIIIKEITSRFPRDRIVAEETAPDVLPGLKGRCWIIDPICGTNNFSRGSNLYATNIALAENGELIAACVINHNERNYIWSTGGRLVYVGKEQLRTSQIQQSTYIIEFDFPTAITAPEKEKTKFTKFIKSILNEKKYYIASYATSLAFTYTALGKIDAYIVPKTRIWDIAAPNFLVMQSGGVVSELDGKPWTIQSNNLLGARDRQLHDKLLELLNK